MASVLRIVAAAALLCGSAVQAQAALVVKNLQVEYRRTPLGIDVRQPRFSWQMDVTAGERGVAQAAYQIAVRNPKGVVVWDSKKIEASEAVHITVRRQRPPAGHEVRVDGDGVDAGGREGDRHFLVRDGLDESLAGPRGVGRREVDRRRRRRPRALLALPGHLRREVRRCDRARQQPRELRLRRERLAADGQAQEHLPGEEREGPELHQAGARHLGRWAGRRTPWRSSTCTAPATRTPTARRSRSGRSRSTAR